MSGWRPKTTKTGGLPNISYEPRKSVDLGTMLENGVEAITGMLAHQDVVGSPEVQLSKEWNGVESHLPDRSAAPKHTAEVLRQVKGASLPKGAWAGGDGECYIHVSHAHVTLSFQLATVFRLIFLFIFFLQLGLDRWSPPLSS